MTCIILGIFLSAVQESDTGWNASLFFNLITTIFMGNFANKWQYITKKITEKISFLKIMCYNHLIGRRDRNAIIDRFIAVCKKRAFGK